MNNNTKLSKEDRAFWESLELEKDEAERVVKLVCVSITSEDKKQKQLWRLVFAYLKREGRKNLTPAEVLQLNRSYTRWLFDVRDACDKCPRRKYLTIDHIIPKIILKDFGVDASLKFFPENFQVLCKPCNMLKSSHLDFANPKTIPLLRRLIERVS